MSDSMSDASLYQRIGGASAVNLLVDHFYERVLADPMLTNFFKGVSIARLKSHQFTFLSQALGGPMQYSGASMQDAHKRLVIEQRHFDAVAAHLIETLKSLSVPEGIIVEIVAAVAPLSNQVVNTPSLASAD